MPTWVVRKAIPTHDHSAYAPTRTSPTPSYLYWAGPDRSLPHATSWVWFTGLCPQVAVFPTQARAEAAARSFAGAHWDATGLHAAPLTAPIDPTGPPQPQPR